MYLWDVFLINNLQPLHSHLFHKLKDFKGKMVQVSELELGGEFGVQIMELTKSDDLEKLLCFHHSGCM